MQTSLEMNSSWRVFSCISSREKLPLCELEEQVAPLFEELLVWLLSSLMLAFDSKSDGRMDDSFPFETA